MPETAEQISAKAERIKANTFHRLLKDLVTAQEEIQFLLDGNTNNPDALGTAEINLKSAAKRVGEWRAIRLAEQGQR